MKTKNFVPLVKNNMATYNSIDEIANAFPGFPPFVHYIIKYVDEGYSSEDAAGMVSEMVDQGTLKTNIDEIERTHARFCGCEIELPEPENDKS